MSGVDPDRELARRALRELGLEGRLRRVAAGLDSTYCSELADGRRVAVRVGGRSAIRVPAALATEAAWIRALHEDGAVVVPAVIAPTTNAPFVLTDADGVERGCLVLSWVAGRKMRWRFAPHHAYALGSVAAELHRHALDFVPPVGGSAKEWSAAAVCGPSTSRQHLEDVAGPEATETVASIQSAVETAFDQIGSASRSLVNGNFGPHNVVWDHRAPALFDFNDLGTGHAAWDLARYLHGLRWRPTGPALVDSALAGYLKVRPLPPGFVEFGPLLEVAAGLFLANHLATRVPERGAEAAQTACRLVEIARRYLARSS